MEVLLALPKGPVISRDASGTLFITGAQGARAVDRAEPIPLLPLLELGPDAVSEVEPGALPIEGVLTLALNWETATDHWPRLAVEWLERTGVPLDLEAVLANFAHSDRGTQQTRHAARRLLRRGG